MGTVVRREVTVNTADGPLVREIEYIADELIVVVPRSSVSMARGSSTRTGLVRFASENLQREVSMTLGAERVHRLVAEDPVGENDVLLLEGCKLDPYDYCRNPGGGILIAEPNHVLRLAQVGKGSAGSPSGDLQSRALPTYPGDARFHEQWALENSGQTGGTAHADIDAPEAWSIERGSPSIVIAIVDSGVDYNHPDLRSRIWNNPGETPGNGLDDDGNGYIDDVIGYDFIDLDSDPADGLGHGTHVAGIAAAGWNDVTGIVGVAPRCRILPVRIFNDQGATTLWAAATGTIYAADMGAQVSNSSWGGYFDSEVIKLAFEYAAGLDVLAIAAAGNGSTSIPSYPASYENVVSVAATDHDDEPAWFTNTGTHLDLAAPGVAILSTFPTALEPTGFLLLSGTSMASPHVAGVAALLRSQDPETSAMAIKAALQTSVDRIDAQADIGTGRINAHKAVGRDELPELTAHLEIANFYLSNTTPVKGTASGEAFDRYVLEVGEGLYPVSWTEISSSTERVEDATLGHVHPGHFSVGWSSLRVRVSNAAGSSVIHAEKIFVDNVYMSSPLSTDIYRKGEALEIRGSVGIESFTSYTVQWQPFFNTFSGAPAAAGPLSSEGITLTGGGDQLVFGGLLADFDTSVVGTWNHIWVQLTAYGSSTYVRKIELYLDDDMQPGFPAYVPHDDDYIGPLGIMEPLVEDLDGNGAKEIYVLTTGRLSGFSPGGNVLANFPVELPIENGERYTTSALTCADVDDDGSGEILFGATRDNVILIHSFESDGSPTSGFPLSFSYDPVQGGDAQITPYSCVVASDVDGDGALELVFQAFDVLVVCERDGALMTPSLIHLRPGATSACPRLPRATTLDTTPAVGNLDRDPQLEIVVFHETPDCGQGGGVDMGILTVFNFDGSIVSGWPRTIPSPAQGSSPVIGDLDGQGGNEIVVAASFVGGSGGIYVFDRFGNLMPGWPQRQFISGFSASPALADLDSDGDLEIVLGDDYQRFVYLFHHTAAPHGAGSIYGISSSYATAIADVDHDGTAEIVATDNDFPLGNYWGWQGFGGQAWDPFGTSLAHFPRVTEANAWAALQVLDIDGDGLLEAIGTSFRDVGEGWWVGQDFKRRGSIYIWNLPWALDPAAPAPWPTIHGNHRRTGCYE